MIVLLLYFDGCDSRLTTKHQRDICCGHKSPELEV
jgi:hypothetical protein